MKLVSAKILSAQAINETGDDSSMFEVAPVSLWLEDYSALKALFDEWRGAGVVDLRGYLAADRGRVEACVKCMRIVRVNRRTLTLFEVDDLPHLVANLGAIFRDEMFVNLIDELAQLWSGRLEFISHGVNYSLSGRRIDIQLKGAVLPGYEAN
jgi:PAS domain